LGDKSGIHRELSILSYGAPTTRLHPFSLIVVTEQVHDNAVACKWATKLLGLIEVHVFNINDMLGVQQSLNSI